MAIYNSRRKRATKKRTRGGGKRTAGGRKKSAASVKSGSRTSPKKIASIDLNTASARELQALPGIGPEVARQIVRNRRKLGRFRSIADLGDVPGIGPAKLAGLRGLARAGRPTPPPKKAKAKKKRRASKAAHGRAKRRKEAQLAALRQDELNSRNAKRRAAARARAKKRRAAIAEEHATRALALEGQPRATPEERQQSREDNFASMQERWTSMFAHAQATDQLPHGGQWRQTPEGSWVRVPLPRTMDSKRVIGEQRLVRIRRLLNERAIERIVYKVSQVARRMSGRYSIWLATLIFSALGERLVGYGTKLLKKDDPYAAFFQTQGFDSTGATGSRASMIERLRSKLEDYARSDRTIVYLHFVKVMNFDRRTGR